MKTRYTSIQVHHEPEKKAIRINYSVEGYKPERSQHRDYMGDGTDKDLKIVTADALDAHDQIDIIQVI
jgi:hypothetical protein